MSKKSERIDAKVALSMFGALMMGVLIWPLLQGSYSTGFTIVRSAIDEQASSSIRNFFMLVQSSYGERSLLVKFHKRPDEKIFFTDASRCTELLNTACTTETDRFRSISEDTIEIKIGSGNSVGIGIAIKSSDVNAIDRVVLLERFSSKRIGQLVMITPSDLVIGFFFCIILGIFFYRVYLATTDQTPVESSKDAVLSGNHEENTIVEERPH